MPELDAYKPLVGNPQKYETVKDIFLETIEKDYAKEKVLELLTSKADLTIEQASSLYDAEIGLIAFRAGKEKKKND